MILVLVSKGSGGQKVGGTLTRVTVGLTLRFGKIHTLNFQRNLSFALFAPLTHSGSFLRLWTLLGMEVWRGGEFSVFIVNNSEICECDWQENLAKDGAEKGGSNCLLLMLSP